jgi:hypothetical protein
VNARTVVALPAAVMLVLVGGLFAITEASASPPASHVLADMRSYAAHARSMTYQALEAVSVPATGGSSLVRQRKATGATALPASTDVDVTEGSTVRQYRTVSGSGVWVRSSTETTTVDQADWVHAVDVAAFDDALLKTADAATAATYADVLVLGEGVSSLIAAADAPHRRGAHPRDLNVGFDVAAIPALRGVDSLTGEIVADSHDHPTSMAVHMRAGSTTIDVTYTLAWGKAVTVLAPDPGSVAASI